MNEFKKAIEILRYESLHLINPRYQKELELAIQVLREENKKNKYPNGWIPATERLPEKYGRVLATYVEYGVEKVGQVTFGDIRQSCKPYELVSGFTLFSKYCEEEATIVAWQPLPKPYKAVKE